tara:strand:+ start:3484 stop:5211 length:1728 start_codon:yes stop_codon:yes gene_type:complete
MRKIVFIFLLFPFILFGQAKSIVVGGVDVDIKDYPWQVALSSSASGAGFCGGSIIANSWVLTAAHCVNGDNPSNLFIRCGSSNSFASGGSSYSVNQIIIHPSYNNPVSMAYDFALIEINDEFSFNENVARIDIINELEISSGAQEPGVRGTITGWGTTSSGGSLASVLQMVSTPIVSNDVACDSSVDENGDSGSYPCSSLHESMICAGDLINGGEDACQGDSGGPLAVRSLIDNRWLLIGVTSWGYGCANVIYPGVWSRVSSVFEWIDNNASVSQYIVIPSLFDFEITEQIHTVIIPDDVVINLLDNSISNSDIIGAFFTNENDLEICAGYTIWQGESDSIEVHGDDPSTIEIDGFQDNVSFKFKLWDYSESVLLNCAAIYNTDIINQAEFTLEGISQITKLQEIQLINSQQILLPESWSIFSSYLTLENMDITNVISPILSQVTVVKDFMGMAYLTDWGFNGIGDIVLNHAYQIKTTEETILNLEGTYINPDESLISLPVGWSLLGYLRTYPANCEGVLEDISSETKILKDYLGNAYLPEWDFNGIGNLEPGKGYQIKMNSNQTLQYHSNFEDY